jgi:hypothetical protein
MRGTLIHLLLIVGAIAYHFHLWVAAEKAGRQRRISRPPAPGRGEQAAAKNGGVPGLQRRDRRTERQSAAPSTFPRGFATTTASDAMLALLVRHQTASSAGTGMGMGNRVRIPHLALRCKGVYVREMFHGASNLYLGPAERG